MQNVILTAAAMAALLLAGCAPSAPPPPAPLHTTIGAAGGQLLIGNGEVSLTVPPGALAGDVAIGIQLGTVGDLAGTIPLGPVYRFTPATTTFAAAAQLVLPFDPARLPVIVDPSEVRIGWTSADGVTTAIVPTFVDTASAFADVRALGTLWVAGPDVVAAATIWPLVNNDSYQYEDGRAVTIARSTTVPNLGGQTIVVVTFTEGAVADGLYLSQAGGNLALVGWFDADVQELLDVPAPLLDARTAMGAVTPTFGAYAGRTPFGSAPIDWTGLAAITATVVERATERGPLGVFDTVLVSIEWSTSDTRGVVGSDRLDLWCADGKGPVRLQRDGDPRPRHLLSGTVSGRAVRGR